MTEKAEMSGIEYQAHVESGALPRPVQAMTEKEKNELRVKVAELCGWKNITTARIKSGMELQYWGDNPVTGFNIALPDYPNCLNACAEFEKTLMPDQCMIYKGHLLELLRYGDCAACMYLFHATATQRCIAFVKVMEEKR